MPQGGRHALSRDVHAKPATTAARCCFEAACWSHCKVRTRTRLCQSVNTDATCAWQMPAGTSVHNTQQQQNWQLPASSHHCLASTTAECLTSSRKQTQPSRDTQLMPPKMLYSMCRVCTSGIPCFAAPVEGPVNLVRPTNNADMCLTSMTGWKTLTAST